MQNKDKNQERAKAWRKIRKHYEQKRKEILGDDHKEIYEAYKAEKVLATREWIIANISNKHSVDSPKYKEYYAGCKKKATEELRNQFKEKYPELGIVYEAYKAEKTQQYRKQFKEDFPKLEAQIDLDDDLKEMARNDIKRIIEPLYRANCHCFPAYMGTSPAQSAKIAQDILLVLVSTILTISVAIYDAYKMCFSDTPPSKIINLAVVAIIGCSLASMAAGLPNSDWEPTLSDYTYQSSYTLNGKPFPNYKTRIENEINIERSH